MRLSEREASRLAEAAPAQTVNFGIKSEMPKPAKKTNPIVLRRGMSIGTGNAESDDEFLFSCFIEYPAAQECLRRGANGMIIAGRTGSGKTAILRHVQRVQKATSELDPAEMSMGYVSNSDALRFLTAIGADLDLLFQVLWKHVLCIEFIRLKWSVDGEAKSKSVFARIVEAFSQDARKKRAIEYLQAWEGKFWITMDENIKELTEATERKLKADMGAEIEKFKAGGQYEKRLSVEKKSELVARARAIINADQLAELHGIIDMLAEHARDDEYQRYFLLVDKLDERWVDDTVRFRLIRALISSLKTFRKISTLKILVCLRDDVLERTVQETQDITFQREKFEDLFVRIRWSKADLKRVIEMRVQELFRRQYSGQIVTLTDVFPNKIGGDDPIDFIIERTLMRPRDVIAFVNECIAASDGQHEVSAGHIRKAEAEYARKRRDALYQEWMSAFPALRKELDFVASHKRSSMMLSDLLDDTELQELAFSISSDSTLIRDPIHGAASLYFEGKNASSMAFLRELGSTLYRVGAIGIKLSPTDKFLYSHIDQPLLSNDLLHEGARIRLHPMLQAAYRLTDATDAR